MKSGVKKKAVNLFAVGPILGMGSEPRGQLIKPYFKNNENQSNMSHMSNI